MEQPANKTRLLPVVVGVLGAAATLVVFPVGLLVAGARGGNVWHFLQEGGWGTWLLLALTMLGTLVTIGIAAWQTSRPRAWASVLSVLPLLLGLLAAGLEWLSMRRVLGALSGGAVDAIHKARIMAMAGSEILVLSVLGGVAVFSLLSAAAVVLGARSLSRITKGGFGLASALGLGAGLVGLVAAFAVALPLSGAPGSSLLFPTVPALAVLAAAVLAGMAIADKKAEEEATALALGDLLQAAAYGLASVLVAATVVHGMGQRFALGALGGQALDPSQVGGFLLEGLRESRGARWHGLFLLPVVLAPAAVLATRLRHLSAALRQAWLGVLVPLGVGALVVLMFIVPRSARLDTLAAMTRSSSPRGLALPVVDSPRERAGSATLVIGKQDVHVLGRRVAATAELSGKRCQDVADQVRPTTSHRVIAVDRAISFEKVACVGRASRQMRSDVLSLVSRSSPADLPPPWNELSERPGSVRLGFSRGKVSSGSHHVHLHVDTWEARFGDKRRTLRGPISERMRALLDEVQEGELGVSADPEVKFETITLLAAQRSRLNVVVYVDTTAEAALNPPAPAAGIGLGSVGRYGVGSGLWQGLGNPGGSSDSKGRVRMGATSVSGRLPPEVIQRIVRSNFGRFRLCYEAELAKKPKLKGLVKVAFVIKRDGTVSSVTSKGSDLPDSKVVGCVVRAFYGLTFPQPEGGVVKVTYPISFKPS